MAGYKKEKPAEWIGSSHDDWIGFPDDVPLGFRPLVQSFNKFTEDNDPYNEHDFGKIEYKGNTIFWKIDYYDSNYQYGSEDPADLSQTKRVLTIMLAEEY